jgi:hypothetical protein
MVTLEYPRSHMGMQIPTGTSLRRQHGPPVANDEHLYISLWSRLLDVRGLTRITIIPQFIFHVMEPASVFLETGLRHIRQ